MRYIIGREDISATIFVPYDCQNNCPFCNSKSMYDGIEGKYENILDELKNSIKFLSENGIVSWVLTGGEPFSDLNKLKIIIDEIKKNAEFPDELKIYVNTTLPKIAGVDNVIEFINNEDNHINGISVSRHFNTFEEDSRFLTDIFEDELISEIDTSVRINIVVTNNIDVRKVVERYNKNLVLNFRKNYLEETLETLHDKDDFFNLLNDNFEHIRHTQCNVCDTDVFVDEKGRIIQYHKGTMLSSFTQDDITEINDFIINIDGKTYTDWDFKTEITQEIFDKIYDELLR